MFQGAAAVRETSLKPVGFRCSSGDTYVDGPLLRFPQTSCSLQVNMVTFGQKAEKYITQNSSSLSREGEKQPQRCAYIEEGTTIIPLREASPGSLSLQREATRTTRSSPPLNCQLACWGERKLWFQQDPWNLRGGRGRRAAQSLELSGFRNSCDEEQEERGAKGAKGRKKLAHDY